MNKERLYTIANENGKHFDSMIWNLTPFLLGGIVVLLYNGITFYVDGWEDSLIFVVRSSLLGIGIILIMYFQSILESANDKKLINLYICQKLEEKFEIQIHKYIDKFPRFSLRGITFLRAILLIVNFFFLASLLLLLIDPEKFNLKISLNFVNILSNGLFILVSFLYIFYQIRLLMKNPDEIKFFVKKEMDCNGKSF